MRFARLRRLLHLCVSLPAMASAGTITTTGGTASFLAPAGVCSAGGDTVWVADTGHHRVCRIDPGGTVTVVAGTGSAGGSGDGGPATAARLSSPAAVCVDAGGALYIADRDNHTVRRVYRGLITTVAGTGTAGYAGDGGPATSARLWAPTGVAVDRSGTLYIADRDNHRVRRVVGSVITTVAGNGAPGFSGDGGPATSARLWSPAGVYVDRNGTLYIADRDNQRLRRVANGLITTTAGNGEAAYAGDGGPAAAASLAYPTAVWGDSQGGLLVADRYNQRLRLVQPDGTMATFAGTGLFGSSGDGGPARSGQLANPTGVAVDSTGQVWIADSGNDRIRLVSRLRESHRAAGRSEPVQVAPGGEAPVLAIGVRGDGTSRLTALALRVSDLSRSTGISPSEIAGLRLYRSYDALLDPTDTRLASQTPVRLDSTTAIALLSPEVPTNLQEVFYLVSVAMATVVPEGRGLKVAFPAGGLSTSEGTVGSAFASADSGRVSVDVRADRLVFSRVPGGAVSGVALAHQPVVLAVDGYGNIDTSFADAVSLTAFGYGNTDTTLRDTVARSPRGPGRLGPATMRAVGGAAAFGAVFFDASIDNEAFAVVADDTPAGLEGDLPAVRSPALRADMYNDPPVLHLTPIAVGEDSVWQAPVASLVSDPDDSVFSWTCSAAHVQAAASAGWLVVRPAADWYGTDTLAVTVRDEHGAMATGRTPVLARPVNDAPRLDLPAVITGREDETVRLPWRWLVTDPESPSAALSLAYAGSPGLGCRQTAGDTLVLSTAADSSGHFRLVVTARDPAGAIGSDTVQVVFLAVNDPPRLSLVDTTMTQDAAVRWSLAARTRDPDDAAAALVWGGRGSAHLQLAVGRDGQATIRADSGWVGSESIVITVFDAAGAGDSAAVRVTVQRVNRAPVISPLTAASVAKGDSLTLDLAQRAADPDGDASPLTWSLTRTADGQARLEGTRLVFVAARRPARRDTVGLRVTDGLGLSTEAVLSVIVSNAPPTLRVADSLTAQAGVPVALPLSGTASDDGPLADLQWEAAADSGLVAHLGPGPTLTVVAEGGWFGQRRVRLRLTDAEGAAAEGSVVVRVAIPNHAPVLMSLADTTVDRGAVWVRDLTRWASDADTADTALVWQVRVSPPGAASVTGSRLFYQAGSGPARTDTLTLQVTDGHGASATGQLHIRVVSQAPRWTEPGTRRLAVGQVDSLALAPWVSDDNPLADLAWSVAASEQVWAEIGPTGRLTLRGQQVGQGRVTVTATDPDANAASTTFTVEVVAADADLDGDGQVGLADFFRLADQFGSQRGDATWQDGPDLDGDGTVSLGDFFCLADQFGRGLLLPPLRLAPLGQVLLYEQDEVTLNLDDYLASGQADEVIWAAAAPPGLTVIVDPRARQARLHGLAPVAGEVLLQAHDGSGGSVEGHLPVRVLSRVPADFALSLPGSLELRRGVPTVMALDPWVAPAAMAAQLQWSVWAGPGLTVQLAGRSVVVLATPAAGPSGQVQLLATSPTGHSVASLLVVTVR